MHPLKRIALGLTLAVPCTTLFAGTPYPTSSTPKAVDAGPLSAQGGAPTATVTIALKLHDAQGAQTLLQTLYTPGTSGFHQFLTPDQFQARFAPTAADVSQVTASLQKFNLTVERASTTTLRVTGATADLERAFQVSLHQFNVASNANRPAYSFRAPLAAATVPADAAPLVHAVFGLSTRPHYHPNIKHISARLAAGNIKPSPATGSGNAPGSLSVTDFASYYHVTPLYDHGLHGEGRTLAIVTLASFTPSDAFAYWSAQGLTVNAKRIKVVDIDGGPGAPSDASGSDETTLDVEQSGGLAPAAKIIVYQAANTNQGFIDAFATAVDANQAETVSTSWGSWEWFNNKANSPVTDPETGRTVGELHAMNEIFLQAALQGQSMFAAAGDAGAYDVNDGTDGNGVALVPPNYSLALSVDSPASDPLITAAGGTTLAGIQTFSVNGSPLTVDIKKERVWSWDYLVPLCKKLGYDPISCGIFPVGGGGGVSIEYAMPFYQFGVAGTQASQPGQAFVYELSTPAQTIDKLPAGFHGRNVPDVSANADPDTGYTLYYTSDQSGFGIYSGNGGTSFVAPQMNGVTTLLGQSVGGRLGLLNPAMYFVAQVQGYGGAKASFNAIKDGNNDFYAGTNGYNPGAGLGTMNVANFADSLHQLYGH